MRKVVIIILQIHKCFFLQMGVLEFNQLQAVVQQYQIHNKNQCEYLVEETNKIKNLCKIGIFIILYSLKLIFKLMCEKQDFLNLNYKSENQPY